MALLTRLHDFIPGSLIQSAQVDAEFQQLVDAMSGVSTTKDILVRFNHASDPALRVDQLGAGSIQRWLQNSVEKAKVNNDGSFETVDQFVSTIATGTKPIDVTSTTVCTNLNADLLDGLNASQFVRNDAAGTIAASDATSLLDINQTGAGAITRFRQGGNNKVVIANDGQIQSSVAGGTAPFTVASNTVVTNLNADLLDGLNSSQFVRNDTAAQTITGDLTISGTNPVLLFTDTTASAADFKISVDANVATFLIDGGSNLMTLNLSTQAAGIPGALSVTGEASFAADMTVSATGSDTTTPRKLGIDPMGSGTAARVLFGDAFNCFQTSFGGKMTIQSYHTLELYGHTLGAGSAPVSFHSSNGSDPHVEFVGSADNGTNVHVQFRGSSGMTAGTTPFIRCVTSGGTNRFDVLEDGDVRIAGTQVLTSRQTGWSAATGTATRTSFATSTVTTAQLAERVKALIDDLITHGVIGA